MAVQVRKVAATIPAGTAIATPHTVDLSFPPFVVDWISVRIPPGPNGNVGWLIGSMGEQVIPFTDTGPVYIVGNDETITWQLTDQPDSGSWELTGYNTGTYDHTLYVTFGLDLPGSTSGVIVAPIASLAG